jgi:hypothetical protein
MALVSIQPLIQMSIKNPSVGKRQQSRKADNLTAIFKLIFWKMWEP